MVLLIGLLPTFTILITDPKNTDKLVIVGSFNLAGSLYLSDEHYQHFYDT